MKTIHCLKDLSEYGIHALTGEACGLFLRVLCDFDERGRRVLEKCFGIPDFKGAEPWNTKTDGHVHVGSIMLDPDVVMTVGIFALLEGGCRLAYRAFPAAGRCRHTWLVSEHALYGWTRHELEADDGTAHREWCDLLRADGWSLRRFAYGGTAADRNRHVFTGRVT